MRSPRPTTGVLFGRKRAGDGVPAEPPRSLHFREQTDEPAKDTDACQHVDLPGPKRLHAANATQQTANPRQSARAPSTWTCRGEVPRTLQSVLAPPVTKLPRTPLAATFTGAVRDGTTRIRRLCAATALLAVAGAAVLAVAPAAAAAAAPCGTRTGAAPKTYRHVIVIMDENKSIGDVIGGAGSAARRAAPYLNQLAAECGLATNYRGATHPSHPNYMAVTGGFDTASTGVNGASIFTQVRNAGGTWRVYQGSMPHNCDRAAAFPYKPQHNPGVAYTPLAGDCARWDTNLNGLKRDIDTVGLPTYAFIAPDQCTDMEIGCGGTNAITVGDNWLKTWIPKLLATRGYRTGHTAIFITWDEGDHGHGSTGEDCLAAANLSDVSCHVATLVISPYVTAGLRSATLFSHYSLLQTTERLLGIKTFLGHAGDASTAGMRSAFGF